MDSDYACPELKFGIKLVDGKECDIWKYLINAVLDGQDVATVLRTSMPNNTKNKTA